MAEEPTGQRRLKTEVLSGEYSGGQLRQRPHFYSSTSPNSSPPVGSHQVEKKHYYGLSELGNEKKQPMGAFTSDLIGLVRLSNFLGSFVGLLT